MTPDRHQTLTRDDLIAGLRELVSDLRDSRTTARIQIVGGAAIALTIHSNRASTVDIDAPLHPAEAVLAAARRSAARHSWRPDWINDAAAGFLPHGYGQRSPEWITIHDDGTVLVQVATPETLLAMKLHAAQRRGNRDAADLAVLLPHCNITTVDGAEALYEAYYSGDSFTDRTAELVEHLLEHPTPGPTTPPPPRLA